MAPPLIEKLEGARPPPILICPSSSCPREPDCPPEAVIPNQHDDLWTRGEADATAINESVARECIANVCFRCRFPEANVDESETIHYPLGGGVDIPENQTAGLVRGNVKVNTNDV